MSLSCQLLRAIENGKVLGLKQQFAQIILDNTQAFFQNSLDGIDTIYSCRKFFGVPDGSYLSTNVKLVGDIKNDFSGNRMKHLLDRYEHNASNFYTYFKKNDESFNCEELKYISRLTHNILGAIDYERVKKTRNENYAYLESKLIKLNQLSLVIPEGAFTYPFYVENGVKIRNTLAEKKIYIPTFCPNVHKDTSESSIEYQYTTKILPLPCDQRYGKEEMDYIIKIICEEVNYGLL